MLAFIAVAVLAVRWLVVWIDGQQGLERRLELQRELDALVPVWVLLGAHAAPLAGEVGSSTRRDEEGHGIPSASSPASRARVHSSWVQTQTTGKS